MAMNFKSKEAFNKWAAYGHIHGDFARTPGNQAVTIKGKAHTVSHSTGKVHTGAEMAKNCPDCASMHTSKKG